ncbi:hypothetical protein GCM10027290_33340 [Micromonospora sonneratiae]
MIIEYILNLVLILVGGCDFAGAACCWAEDQCGPQAGRAAPTPACWRPPAGIGRAGRPRGLRPEPRPSSEMPPQITSPGTTRATSLPGQGPDRTSGRALHLDPVRGGWTVWQLPGEEIRSHHMAAYIRPTG